VLSGEIFHGQPAGEKLRHFSVLPDDFVCVWLICHLQGILIATLNAGKSEFFLFFCCEIEKAGVKENRSLKR
jgi:hypothetical protein